MKKTLLLSTILFVMVFAKTQAQANCTSGDCVNGFGTFVYNNGDTYVGNWKNDKRDGKGTYTWAVGGSYIGDWIENAQTGSCVNNHANGDKYVGQILNGKREGEGVYTLANGYYKKGIFKNNIGVTVKYYNNQNIEVSEEKFDEAVRDEEAKKKEKLQIQSITIPEPNGVYTMTDRANHVKMQFCTSTQNIFCVWGNTPTFFTVNEAKLVSHSTYETLIKSEIGREIIGDFNKSSSSTNLDYSPHFKQKGYGYANEKFQIKINKGKPLGINNDSTYTVALYNYQKFIDDEIVSKFSFWKDENERKAFHKKEKEKYFDWIDANFNKHAQRSARDEFDEKKRTRLTDVHASYDSIKSMAHVVFAFSQLELNRSYNVMYDINFKDKTYKKIGESEFEITVNDDCYSYVTSIEPNKIEGKKGFKNYRIINFVDNSILNIDKAYVAKLNALTNPPGDVEFVATNKDYIIFKSELSDNSGRVSYYFVNKSNNFCEKIVTINGPSELVFNSDFSMAAYSKIYKLNPNDSNYVSSVYVLDFENLTAKLIDDHEYQMEAINNKIINDNEYKRQSDEKDLEYYNRNAAITRQNEQVDAQNAAAQAERTAKCLCCHGTGKQENKGMYLGEKTYSVTPVNGLGISHEETVSQYGASTYTTCTCCSKKY